MVFRIVQNSAAAASWHRRPILPDHTLLYLVCKLTLQHEETLPCKMSGDSDGLFSSPLDAIFPPNLLPLDSDLLDIIALHLAVFPSSNRTVVFFLTRP